MNDNTAKDLPNGGWAPSTGRGPLFGEHAGGQGIPAELDRHTVDADEIGIDPAAAGVQPIVAYACDECEAAMEVNFLDEHGKVVGNIASLPKNALEQCPLCQGTNLRPLTQAEFDAAYKDDGSDEFDPSQRERI